MVKAQIHAGGRGKAGGVKLVRSEDEVAAAAKALLGHHLVTHQTGPAGREVKRVYVEEGCDIARELYLGILIDRETGRVTLIASTEGGVEIEEVAEHSPDKILKVAIDPATGIEPFHAREIAFGLGLEGKQVGVAVKFVTALYRAFTELDASIAEINPLVVTGSGELVALDAKVGVRRQRALPPSRDRRPARRGRGGPDRGRGRQARAQLHQARRQYRLHGQRRRPRDGDDGHHQALWRQPGEFPRCRRRGDARAGRRPRSS